MRGVGGDVHALVAGERRFEDFGLERLAVLFCSSVRFLHPSRFCVRLGLLPSIGASRSGLLFKSASSGNVLLGVFAVICTGALPFCWSPTQPILTHESL